MSSLAKSVVIVARIMRALRARPWCTSKELAPAVAMRHNTLQPYMRRMMAEGLVKAKHRTHEYDADGNRPAGPKPREYRLASEFGGLS